MAKEKGFFDKAGVAINMTTTPSSAFQAENLVNGKFHIAGTAFDNVVAYQEGQGAVKFDRQPDLFAFMGATQVELAFIVAPEIKTYAGPQGQVAGARRALDRLRLRALRDAGAGGLQRSDYSFAAVGATPQRWESVRAGQHVGTLTIEPFTSIAKAQGFTCSTPRATCFRSIRAARSRRAAHWAAANPDALKGFIRGYLAGLAWTLEPENRQEATETLLRNMPEIKPPVAGAVMNSLLSPKSGPDARRRDPDGRRARGARSAHPLRQRQDAAHRSGEIYRSEILRRGAARLRRGRSTQDRHRFRCALIASNPACARSNFSLNSHIAARISR